MTQWMLTYLSHSNSSLLSKGVVIEVEDTKACVVLHGFGQGCYTRVIDTILRHVNFLQTTYHLENSNHIFSKISFTFCLENYYCIAHLYKDQEVKQLTAKVYMLCGGYLEGLSKGSSSIVLQPVSPCDKHL